MGNGNDGGGQEEELVRVRSRLGERQTGGWGVSPKGTLPSWQGGQGGKGAPSGLPEARSPP